MQTRCLFHGSYQASDEHAFLILKRNFPHEHRAHASSPGMARGDRPGRHVYEVKVDARAPLRRRDPDDLARLGRSTVEYFVPRHND